MLKNTRFRYVLTFLAVSFAVFALIPANAAEKSVEEAWKTLPKYEYGQDMAALLAIDREVINAMASPTARSACAARLAGILEAKNTTLAARQYICLQLRQVGAPAEVPVLARMLADPKTSQMARDALESIPGEQSLAALRDSLGVLQGEFLVGAINSLAARKDSQAVPKLKELAEGNDETIASAALWSLGRIGGPQAVEILSKKAAGAAPPLPQHLAVPYLSCAAQLADEGKTAAAAAIYQRMSGHKESLPSRKAALQGLLTCAGDKRFDTTIRWLAENDPLKQQLAAGELNHLEIDDTIAKTLLDKLPEMPVSGRILLLESLAAKRLDAVRPAVLAAAAGGDPPLKRAALRCLASVGGAEDAPLLLEEILRETPFAETARESLTALPGDYVDRAILAAMKNAEDATRATLIDILRLRKSTLALSELLKEAGNEDPSIHMPAIVALRSLTKPSDVPALTALLLNAKNGKHRDEIEKTILLLCKNANAGKKVVEAVLQAYAAADAAKRCTLLPLLGRLGGKNSLEIVTAAMQSDDPELKAAGVRALCNWPDASVADRLLSLAETSKDRSHRTWALRAYVRVVTLKNKRPESETLEMLKKAMTLADADSERRLIIERAAAVRTIDSLRWIAPYLDDPALNQAACLATVELAHHRFLRTPNRAEFAAALQKVVKISNDSQVVERAKRYLLGM